MVGVSLGIRFLIADPYRDGVADRRKTGESCRFIRLTGIFAGKGIIHVPAGDPEDCLAGFGSLNSVDPMFDTAKAIDESRMEQ